jgi:hypothetical protein
MNLFCPGCGTRISAAPSPLDADGTVVCPRCHSRFSTSGVVATAPAEPKKKFKPKKKGGGAAVAIGVGLCVLVLIGAGAAAMYFAGWFSRSPSSEITTKGPGGSVTTWREYSSAEGRFKAMLPGTPERIVRARKDVEFRVDAAHVQASVVFADLPERMPAEKLMVAPPGSKMIGERELELGQHRGREIIADIPNRGIVHMRYYLAGKRLYTVMIVGKSAPAAEADVARLFDSFQITG